GADRDARPRRSRLSRSGRSLVRGLPGHVPRIRANQTALGGVSAGRWSRGVCQRGPGAGGHPCRGHSGCRTRRRTGDGWSVNGRGLGLAGTIVVHGVAVALLTVGPAKRKPLPPTYAVHLVAAPAPDQETRKAPEAFDRPAEEKPAPVPAAKPPPR